jgi:hypothetical protein
MTDDVKTWVTEDFVVGAWAMEDFAVGTWVTEDFVVGARSMEVPLPRSDAFLSSRTSSGAISIGIAA